MNDDKLKAIAEMMQEAVKELASSPPQIEAAQRLAYDAYRALVEMLEPPDPYKDMNLRPGLGYGNNGKTSDV